MSHTVFLNASGTADPVQSPTNAAQVLHKAMSNSGPVKQNSQQSLSFEWIKIKKKQTNKQTNLQGTFIK